MPRLLAPDELPHVSQQAVRQLIDLTAAGQPTPAGLRTRLLTVDADALLAAILEGIHRWHTDAPSTPAASAICV